jgi:predicted transcriptional regulator
MSRSEQYRVKTEISHLLDKGLSLREKYGGEYGWRITLRHDEKRKGEVL